MASSSDLSVLTSRVFQPHSTVTITGEASLIPEKGESLTKEEPDQLRCSDEVDLFQDQAMVGSESDEDSPAVDQFWTPIQAATIFETEIRSNIPANVELLLYIDGQKLPKNAFTRVFLNQQRSNCVADLQAGLSDSEDGEIRKRRESRTSHLRPSSRYFRIFKYRNPRTSR